MPQGLGVGIKFEFQGKTEMFRAINSFGASLNDFTEALDECADDFYKEMKKTFDTEGRSIGRPWKPLSPSYARTKAENGSTQGGILVRTGALKRSVTDRNDPNAVCEVHNMTLKLGSKVKTEKSNIPLLILHQYGWDKPEIIPTQASALKWGSSENPVFARKSKAARVDARPIVKMNVEMKKRWIDIFRKHINMKLNDASALSSTQQQQARH